MNRVLGYLREVRAELKKVVWPTRRETGIFTLVVLASVTLVATVIWVMDAVLGALLKLVVSG